MYLLTRSTGVGINLWANYNRYIPYEILSIQMPLANLVGIYHADHRITYDTVTRIPTRKT